MKPSSSDSPGWKERDIENFQFRRIHPSLFMGTASDRYSGWVGQIYTRELYEGRIRARTHRVGPNSFREEVLPVESVDEYFQHFGVLEIDYTFYDTLLCARGNPTATHRILGEYRQRLSGEDALVLKVPRLIFARKIMQAGKLLPNPLYLDPEAFVRRFYEPACRLLGNHLRGMVFEQEYQRASDRASVDRFIEELDNFFRSIPRDDRYHIEVRTPRYLVSPVFSLFLTHGIGQVLSHWTWLPPLSKQWDLSGRRGSNRGGQVVLRLMTPRGMRYEQAYARAQPFDKLVPGMLQPDMIEDTVRIIRDGLDRGLRVHVIVNNRAGGNAPRIARRIARLFLVREKERTPEA